MDPRISTSMPQTTLSPEDMAARQRRLDERDGRLLVGLTVLSALSAALGTLHAACDRIFRDKPDPDVDRGPLGLYRHQVDGIRAGRAGDPLSKDQLLVATGIDDKGWPALIKFLLEADLVAAQGKGRGTRYTLC